MSILGLVFQKKIADFFTGKTKAFVFPYGGKNIFNKDSVITNKYINNTGFQTNSEGWRHSDYIFVIGGMKLKISHLLGASSLAGGAFYDSSKNFISFISNSEIESASRVIIIPYNAEYIRLSIEGSVNLNTFQVEYGEITTSYEEYNPTPTQPDFRNTQKIEIVKSDTSTYQKIVADFFGSKIKPITFPYGKNIFNKDALINGKYINSSGIEVESVGVKCTDFIFVVSGQKLITNNSIGTSSVAGIAFYDRNKVFISFVNQVEFNNANRVLIIPQNAEYVRFSISGGVIESTLQIEYGEISTTYENYSSMPKQPSFFEPQEVIINNSKINLQSKYTQKEFSAFSFPHAKNLFNPDSIITNAFINSTGGVSQSEGWKATNFIPVISGAKLKISGPNIGSSSSASTAFFDKNKAFINKISNVDIIANNNILNIPDNAEYFRFSTIATDVTLQQIEYGTNATSFESFNPIPTLPPFKDELSFKLNGITDYPLGIHLPVSMPCGKNLFNANTAIDNKLINTSGNEQSEINWFASDFIPVFPSSNIKVNSLNSSFSTTAGAAFYDSKKVFISFLSSQLIGNSALIITVPKDAVYMRISDFGLTRKNTLQIEYGTISTSYEKFEALPRTLIQPVSEKNKIPFSRILNSNKLDVYLDQEGSLHACYKNIYVRYRPEDNVIAILKDGFNSNPELVLFNSTNFPGLISSSTPIRLIILPFSRNTTSNFSGIGWRINVITNKGQIFHNFPSRSTVNDGDEQSNDYKLFDEGCIWELPERWAPVKTTEGSDATLIATGKYKYYPALADAAYVLYPAVSQDNGYGNGGFPAVLEKINQAGQTVKFARYHQQVRSDADSVSLDFMGGLVINEKLCAIGTYRNNIANSGARICVYYTNDGGRNWFCRYEFGAAGQIINSSDTQLAVPVTNHISHDLFVDLSTAGSDLFQVVKRSQYAPSLAVKEPVNMFKYASPVLVSSITAASSKITVVTAAAHGLVSGDVILFEKQSGAAVNDWDWLVNSGHNANSAGDGLIFKIVVVNSTSFTLKQAIHNPHNNLACRHIHSLNKGVHGIVVGCGEVYPEGWIVLHNYYQSDSFARLMPWDTFNFIRLTSTNVAAQRPLGFILKHDGEYLIGMDNESTDIGNITLPDGRTGSGIRKTSTGVYKGTISTIDNLASAECVLESNEVCYFFQEINGVILFIGQLGEIGISSDGGETWIRWKINVPVGSLSRFSGAMNDRMFMVQNYIFHLK